jgi:AcrR family transcriptional regulator
MSRALLSFVVSDPLSMHSERVSTPGAPQNARARVRAELTREIKDVARRQLAESGAAALSLRAVARELGMVSSAVYRYFPSRDELLTALIVDAYEAVGAAAMKAEKRITRKDLMGRWMATARAFRTWAVANPQEYALIFGSPIPGYQAPQDTIDPASRIPLLLLAVVNDRGQVPTDNRPIPRSVRADLRTLSVLAAPEADEAQLARSLLAWSQLVGLVSFELFGHLHNVIHDYKAHFDFQMQGIGAGLGLGQ